MSISTSISIGTSISISIINSISMGMSTSTSTSICIIITTYIYWSPSGLKLGGSGRVGPERKSIVKNGWVSEQWRDPDGENWDWKHQHVYAAIFSH